MQLNNYNHVSIPSAAILQKCRKHVHKGVKVQAPAAMGQLWPVIKERGPMYFGQARLPKDGQLPLGWVQPLKIRMTPM